MDAREELPTLPLGSKRKQLKPVFPEVFSRSDSALSDTQRSGASTPTTPHSARTIQRKKRQKEIDAITTQMSSRGKTLGSSYPVVKRKNTVVVQTSSSPTDIKKSKCIETLVEGNIEAFIDLFELSYRPPLLIDEIAETYYSVREESIPFLKENLSAAETARRTAKHSEVYKRYKAISAFFESERDIATAKHYLEKALHLMTMSYDMRLEAIAHEELGLLYERVGDTKSAIEEHEAHLKLVEKSGDTRAVIQARKRLVTEYMHVGDEHESRGEYDNALVYYTKSQQTAQACHDKSAEAEITYKLASLYEAMDEKEQSIATLEAAIPLCDFSGNINCKLRTLSTLGRLYEESNDTGKAVEAAETTLSIISDEEKSPSMVFDTEQSDLPRMKGAILEKLGGLYHKMADVEKSVDCFEQCFQLAQKSGDIKWIDQSKIKLGFAKGNMQLSTFIELISGDDVHELIRWRNNRGRNQPRRETPPLPTRNIQQIDISSPTSDSSPLPTASLSVSPSAFLRQSRKSQSFVMHQAAETILANLTQPSPVASASASPAGPLSPTNNVHASLRSPTLRSSMRFSTWFNANMKTGSSSSGSDSVLKKSVTYLSPLESPMNPVSSQHSPPRVGTN